MSLRLFSKKVVKKFYESNLNKFKIDQCRSNSTITENFHDLGHFDIVINGGGIVGLNFLINLQQNEIFKNKKILLIEQQKKPNLSKSFNNQSRVLSNRVLSITDASKKNFEKIGIWSDVKNYVKPIKEMKIWSYKSDNFISFNLDNFNDNELENITYIVENNIITHALNQNINHENFLYSTTISDIKEDDNKISLFTSNNQKLSTTLLIGCDGFNSIVRQKSNIKYFNLPLSQNGIVGTVEILENVENLNNEISFQRFLPDQYKTVIAILPLTKTESSFVISTSKDYAAKLMNMDDEMFVNKFNELLNFENNNFSIDFMSNICNTIKKSLPSEIFENNKVKIMPKITSILEKSRASFPLGFGTTLPNLTGGIGNSLKTNVVLIGDSAHRVHPLAGQGLNLGIGDSIVLSECLIESLERGEDLFDISDNKSPLQEENLKNSLNKYERERQLKLILMMSFIHSMQDLFYYTPPILLNAFNQMKLIKKQMTFYANSP